MKVGVTMPMGTQPIGTFPMMARAAEDAGFDAVWDFELYENPLIVLAAAAHATTRIQLGTGVATTLSRTPFELANAAADVDELSDGRLLLGIGLGIPGLMATLHGAGVDHPLARMREYTEALKLCFDYLADESPADYQGRHYRFVTPPFNPLGSRGLKRRIPVYLGGMNPKMIQLAGELGDGLVGGGYSRLYVKDTVLPNLSIGAQRSGRDVSELTTVTQVICCVSTDRAEAIRRARIHVGQLVANPVQDGIVAAHGLEKEVDEVRQALGLGGPAALGDVTDDKLIETFSIAGSPEECRAQLQNWDGLIAHVMLHTPYVPPLTPAETEDAYYQILSAFARPTE
jgi:probable F420-dependent oxidoreductase